ncbi:MAG TPA: hypothetical protein VM733_21310 [Thermoanaerobaculia bacterium]|nr:hypothetical protein [Thermoanaerobaculia bacterium]
MNVRERFLGVARSPDARNHTLAHIEHLLELLPHADETLPAAVWFPGAIYARFEDAARANLQREVSDPVGASTSPV